MQIFPSFQIILLIWTMIPQQNSCVYCTAFIIPITIHSSPPDPTTLNRSTLTPLHMGSTSIVDRLSRVVKSNVNKWVSNIENPEKVINQSVNDLQNDLVKVRQSYAEALASQRRIQRQLDDADRVANEWYNRAQLALRQSQKQHGGDSLNDKNERLAREALLRRETELDRKAMIQKQLDTQTMATEQLYTAIVTLEQKIREVLSKQQQLVARARTAQATQQIQSMIAGQLDSTTAVSNSMNAFTRMEQKVEAMEAAVEASIELNQKQWTTSLSTASVNIDATTKNLQRSLEDEFRYLEQSSKIEEELEILKNNLNFEGNNRQSSVAAIGPASASIGSIGVAQVSIDGEQGRRAVTIPILRREEILSVK